MNSRYQRYAHHVPKYLGDYLQKLFTYCLKEISMANSIDLMEVVMIDHRLLSTLSYESGYKKKYKRKFGDKDNMLLGSFI